MVQPGPMSKYNTKICAVKRHLTFFEECQNIKSGYLTNFYFKRLKVGIIYASVLTKY